MKTQHRLIRATLSMTGIAIITFSIYVGIQAGWLHAKAIVAQHLLEQAWTASASTNEAHKPWPWADVRTSARLSVPAIDETFIVLSDASGEAMAFGPGLVAGDPLSADSHTLAIGGHRDTHLAFLETLPVGANLTLENMAGKTFDYTLVDKQVVNSQTHTLHIADQHAGLVLITCYPFHASQTGGPMRLVARAVPI